MSVLPSIEDFLKEQRITRKELQFQNEEKEKRAAELVLANIELKFQNGEKEKRAAELVLANDEILSQNKKIEKQLKELVLSVKQIETAGMLINEAWRYNASLIEASLEPILTIDQDGKIINANSAVANATGLSKKKLVGTDFSQLFTDSEKASACYQTVFEKGKAFNYELNLKHIKGFVTPVIYNAFVCKDELDKKIGIFVTNDDFTADEKLKDETIFLQINLKLLIKQKTSELITANKKLAKENDKNEYLGYHDHLTGLYNRRYFEEKLKSLDTNTNLPISIIMCDINGLKLINDSFGHGTGDDLLIKAAKTIKNSCRARDIVARLGGDEFVVLLPKTAAEEASQVADRIKEFASTVKIEKIDLSISSGFDTKKTAGQSIIEIFANAENYMYRNKMYERTSMRSKIVDLIMKTLFEKSGRESLHSARVSRICQAIASEMKFDKGDVDKMRIAGLVHDIGKIGIGDAILNKVGNLSSEERAEIERHPEIGWRILSTTTEFLELSRFVLCHHERLDGGGYPNGLKGETIPPESRIIAIADAFDAMTGERSYREALNQEDAIQELKRCSGTQFDPEIVDVFVNKVLPSNSNFTGGKTSRSVLDKPMKFEVKPS